MTVRKTAEGDFELIGECGLDDAEPLLRGLLVDPSAVVDMRQCERVHTAILQVLLASRSSIRGPAAGSFVRDRLEPLLNPR